MTSIQVYVYTVTIETNENKLLIQYKPVICIVAGIIVRAALIITIII